MYSSSIVKRFLLKSEVSKDKLVSEKDAFIVKKRGTLAFKGNEPLGS
jgi:hypothetical protein